MAEGKKSFILYADLITVVEKLVLKDREDKTNHAGELFLHVLKYVNDKEPIPISFIVDMAFEPIKLSLKRDLKKYEVYIDKQRENGKKGGRPKKPTQSEITQPFKKKPKKADSVNDSDSVIKLNIVDRKAKFATSLTPFLDEYGKQLLNDFFGYWTEHGDKDKKMRFEKEKSYSVKRRLQTWKKNDFNNNKPKLDNGKYAPPVNDPFAHLYKDEGI